MVKSHSLAFSFAFRWPKTEPLRCDESKRDGESEWGLRGRKECRYGVTCRDSVSAATGLLKHAGAIGIANKNPKRKPMRQFPKNEATGGAVRRMTVPTNGDRIFGGFGIQIALKVMCVADRRGT
jgi:hypothetical protein